MGNEATKAKKSDVTVLCSGCKKVIKSRDSKYKKCAFLNCSVVYCGDCKKDCMFKHGRGTYYCGEHHFALFNQQDGGNSKMKDEHHTVAVNVPQKPPSARQSAVKRTKPPTPALTPGTQSVFRPNESTMDKRIDQTKSPSLGGYDNGPIVQFAQNPPFATNQSNNNYFQQPQPQFMGDSLTQASKTKTSEILKQESDKVSPGTAAAAHQAAQSAAMAFSQSLGKSMNTTGTINSVDLLNKMLETKGDSGLMIHGDLDTNNDGNSVRPRKWGADEDHKLRIAVSQYGARHWKTIATFVPGRTHVQCLQRWNKVLKPGLKKGPWTEEEDTMLQGLVEKMQPNVQWGDIAEKITGRSAKQCRERWSFNLDPNINKGDWTTTEDETLLKAQAEHGNKWSKIANLLPGRTENAIKTRFKSIVRAKKREWRPAEDALLLAFHEELGNDWQAIAAKIPNRTKNACKTRCKFLTDEKLPEKSEPKPKKDNSSSKKKSTVVRTGASQSAKAQASTAEARARARKAAAAALLAAENTAQQLGTTNQQQNNFQAFAQPGQQQSIQPNFQSHQMGGHNNGQSSTSQSSSLGSFNSMSVSMTKSKSADIQKDLSKVMLSDMLDDLANIEFEDGMIPDQQMFLQQQQQQQQQHITQTSPGYREQMDSLYAENGNKASQNYADLLRQQGGPAQPQFQTQHTFDPSQMNPVTFSGGSQPKSMGGSYSSAFDDLNLEDIMQTDDQQQQM